MSISTRNILSGLEEYKGEWGTTQITHLLKRVMFGAKQADINYFKTKTLSQTIDELLTPQPTPDPPINNYQTADYIDPTGVLAGATWVHFPYGDGTVNGRRRASYKSWWLQQMFYQNRSIHEKMILFWHNHFATEIDTVDDARFAYTHHTVLRKNALGNFKQFVREITLDPAMLRYLNGNRNTKNAPDENYARELQELFTLGKGPDSKYTEDDVKAAAKILTGFNIDGTKIVNTFNANNHDITDKKFSSFYDNAIIKGRTTNNGLDELDELLNMIFKKEEVSKFICRKIYQFFVHYDLNEVNEKNIITPLAEIFRKNNFEIKPVLMSLFKSQHFFDEQLYGSSIKPPLELIIGTLREFDTVLPDRKTDYVSVYSLFSEVQRLGSIMQQDIGDPPNVAGWPAYYQQPVFYEAWVNTDTYPKRNQFTDTMVLTGITRNTKKIQLDVVAFAKRLQTPNDPNKLIAESLDILYKIPISKELIDQLKKDILLSGQSTDYYWTELWDAMITKPSDTNTLKMVTSKLQNLYKYILSLPEYQLS